MCDESDKNGKGVIFNNNDKSTLPINPNPNAVAVGRCKKSPPKRKGGWVKKKK